MNGEIVWLGRQLGIPTPVNALLQELAAELAARRAQPGTLPASEFYRQLAGRGPA